MSNKNQSAPFSESVEGNLPKSLGTGTRIDPPHVAQEPPEIDEIESLIGEAIGAPDEATTLVHSIEQVHNQASQLASYLRKQQGTIDRREAELNARTAAFENQVRSARIWLVERQQDLETQQADAHQLRESLAARDAELIAAERDLNDRQNQLFEAEQHVASKLHLVKKAEALASTFGQLDARTHYLDEGERMLAAREEELQQERIRLVNDRKSLHEQLELEHRKLTDEQQKMLLERDKERQKLKRKREDLESRQTALKQLRADLSSTQQETLEMRVAMEELWTRLRGGIAPATITQSIAELRAKLADRQQLARQDLDEQRLQLESLAKKLAQQHKQLTGQRRELQDWVSRREAEINSQAAALVAREQDLDRQESDFQHGEDGWQQERQRYEREIRRLLAELRHVNVAA